MSIASPIQVERVPITGSELAEAATAPPAASPVVVTTSFRLLPGREEEWLAVWRTIGRLALSRSDCYSFRLLRDRREPTNCLAQSEWESPSAFNAFVRDARLVWLNRSSDYAPMPVRFTYFEALPFGSEPELLAIGAD